MKDKTNIKNETFQIRLTTIQLEALKLKAKKENKTITKLIIEKTLTPKK